MIITEQVVKTTYSIRFTLSEFQQMAREYQNSSDQHRYARAFNDIDIDKLLDTEKPEIVFFRELSMKGNPDTFKYIAEYFGFDGWSNAGYYSRTKECYCMQVFDYGDTIKK